MTMIIDVPVMGGPQDGAVMKVPRGTKERPYPVRYVIRTSAAGVPAPDGSETVVCHDYHLVRVEETDATYFAYDGEITITRQEADSITGKGETCTP
jgi:hypothetical protein